MDEEGERATFLKEYKGYGYAINGSPTIDAMRKSEFPHMQDQVYLDHAATSIYAKSQLENYQKELMSSLHANPHSLTSNTSTATSTTAKIDDIRRLVLAFFHTTAQEYSVIFTSGATSALKLVGDCFPWSSDGSVFAHTINSHTSVLGIRALAQESGATTRCVDLEEVAALQQQAHHTQSKSTNNQKEPEQNSPDVFNLFAFPAECNFSGVQHDLALIQHVQSGAAFRTQTEDHSTAKWLVLLDAAKFVCSQPLDLSRHHPDFVCLSFYKLFGYPTGLGALLVRNQTLPYLQKRYYGGGTVDRVLVKQNEVEFRGERTQKQSSYQQLASRFEDGTVSFLSILALKHGFAQLETLQMPRIHHHTTALTRFLVRRMRQLLHSNDRPLCELYGNHDQVQQHQTQGPIVTFNLKRADGSYVGYAEVGKLASIHEIGLRTGCFCNPGACTVYLRLEEEQLMQQRQAGHVCGDAIDLVDGYPTGAIRVSIGYMTTYEEVQALVSFLTTTFLQPKTTATPTTTILPSPKQRVVLQKITVFPLKSCAGMQVQAWPLSSRGLLYDREWAVVDVASGKALSQKDLPQLCFLQAQVDLQKKTLTLCYDDHLQPPCSFELALFPMKGEFLYENECSAQQMKDVKVCFDACKGQDVGRDVAAWLSECLARPVSLLRVSSSHLRDSQSTKGPSTTHEEPTDSEVALKARAKIGFANQAQYLVISRNSVAHFNQEYHKVTQDPALISEDVFRANFVLDGCRAYEEDSWTEIRIGTERFQLSGPCSRCSMVNIDPKTAQYDRTPLKVLSSYRRTRSKIFFGQFLTRVVAGKLEIGSSSWLRVGDEVSITA